MRPVHVGVVSVNTDIPFALRGCPESLHFVCVVAAAAGFRAESFSPRPVVPLMMFMARLKLFETCAGAATVVEGDCNAEGFADVVPEEATRRLEPPICLTNLHRRQENYQSVLRVNRV